MEVGEGEVAQKYAYAFSSETVGGYEVLDASVNGGSSEDLEGKKNVGLIDVEAGTEKFFVTVEVEANGRLDSSDSLTLEVAAEGVIGSVPKIATASLDDGKIVDCDPPDELVISAIGACIPDGNVDKATFAFKVDLSSGYNNRGQVFSYRFDATKALSDGYEVKAFYVNGEKQDVPAKQGALETSDNSFNPVSNLNIQVDVQAAGKLDGTESLTLMLDNVASPADLTGDSPSASAVIENFDACPPALDESSDVALYLVLDNSTSMLLPDPSTNQAEQKDRIEGQDRVSLYAFEKAIKQAGYGFSRQGEDVVLSGEQFREALINNGSESLSAVIDGFDVIVNPDFEGEAKQVTVNLINYGYAVEYGQLSFDQSSTDQAIKVAKTILDVKTPDQIYGNSITENSTWISRDLPDPEQRDLFQGEGRLSSNLYSGTEMLGALQGLEHLLSAQAKSRDADELTTLVSMVTDGRPERRSWWDTRTGAGSDSITGVSVPLPDALGGDSITTSGLIYDADGNHTFLENNRGQKQWKKMQRQLNQALDSIAARSDNPAEALQVEVMAMGESSDANFPAIYADLFGNRTFDNSTGGWSYDVFNSFGLPDFLG